MIKAYFILGATLFYAVLIVLILTLSGCGSSGGGFSTQLIPGPRGYTSLVQISYANFDSTICLSETGVILYTGIDYNNSGTLEGQEITDTKIICNGANGLDGEDAPTPDIYITEIIDPCGDAPNIIDEVLLRLADGRLLASVSDKVNGQNTRLSIISEGVYQTSDGSNCIFQVLSDNSVIW